MAMKRALASLLPIILLLVLGAAAQQAAPPAASPPPATAPSAAFLQTADEVLVEMSKLLALPVKSPLKKSVRTREEIRAYLVRRMKEDKEPEKRYADQKVLEKLGLIPKGFQLESFLLDLLTEQIAGLYDPKGQEFFIADWISPADQRVVMAHELTHALQDQHFKVDPWLEAAKPNDDAALARDAVLEGSALAAMIDYLLRGQPKSVRDLGDMDPTQLMGEVDKSPSLAKAPPFVRDELLFPYTAGTSFTQRVLRASSGWGDFHKVFESPPVSTQQILHPDLYLEGVAPRPVALPDLSGLLPAGWKKLDENLLGEFGLQEILKHFLGETRAKRLSPAWAGDRYAILEHQQSKQLLLLVRLRLASEADAARFFGHYSEALELKYDKRRELFRRPNFFSFEADDGGVFLRCLADQCLSLEGGSRELFDKIARAIGWPPGPVERHDPYHAPQKATITTVALPPPSEARATISLAPRP
ncbi:MAG: hypothetical protein HY237_04895 [Acidobacteria bacterium]|nr:hypothetical protein [Acidobacteriota bacterium]